MTTSKRNLTERRLQILSYLQQGKTYKQIAELTGLRTTSVQNVKQWLTNAGYISADFMVQVGSAERNRHNPKKKQEPESKEKKPRPWDTTSQPLIPDKGYTVEKPLRMFPIEYRNGRPYKNILPIYNEELL